VAGHGVSEHAGAAGVPTRSRLCAGDAVDPLAGRTGTTQAGLIAQPGSVAHGSEQVRAALQSFLALKGSITLDAKLVVAVGDLAYLSNTWSLSGTGPDGNLVALVATTAEVARRQADGSWRYVIDNAWGRSGGLDAVLPCPQSVDDCVLYPQVSPVCGFGRRSDLLDEDGRRRRWRLRPDRLHGVVERENGQHASHPPSGSWRCVAPARPGTPRA